MADRDRSVRVFAVSAAVAGAAMVAGFVAYRTIVGPRLNFEPQTETFLFERDAVSGQADPVPVDELFSLERMERYRDGDGFTATFRIENDPRTNGEPSETDCGLEPWSRFAETSNPARRALIAQRESEFRQCVADFNRRLSIVRSVEIGVDDTDGMDPGLAEFVRRALASEDVTGERIFEMSRQDAVHLVFFRLSNIEAYDHRLYTLDGDTSPEEIERAWDEGLNRWLLRERGPRTRTSIARGVFNALSRNASIQSREIHIFSDGMENSPEVTSFYEIIDDPFDHAELDAEMSELIRCPGPPPGNFEMTWHFTPLDIPFYYRIRDYWDHVLRDVCRLPATAVLY